MRQKKESGMEEKKIRENVEMTSLQKAWAVLFPCLLYYLAYSAAYIILQFVLSAAWNGLGEGAGQWLAAHTATISGVAGGACMVLGILLLMPMLRGELALRRRNAQVDGRESADSRRAVGGDETAVGWESEDRRQSACGRELIDSRKAMGGDEQVCGAGLTEMVKRIPATVLLAFSASLGLNILLTLTGFADASQTYQEVAGRQYGVAFGVGIILYGVISPLAEEVVFRGVVYNRLRRFYGPVIGAVVSGVFFGAFHGNLVQGVYGACMGILIAYVYERQGSFFFPVIFHAVANLAVYGTARLQTVQEAVFTPLGCGIALAAALAVCIYLHSITC